MAKLSGDVGRVIYRDDLNRTWAKHNKAKAFVDGRGKVAGKNFLDLVLRGVVGKEGDIHLGYCMATHDALTRFADHSCEWGTSLRRQEFFSVFVFPVKGEVDKYELNPEGKFFSDAHRNPDPVVIRWIQGGIHLHPEYDDNVIYFGYRQQHSVPNEILGGVLLKKPFNQYEGYEDYLNYDPSQY